MEVPETLGIIAGNGVYPRLLADAARRAGVKRIVAAAFTDETDDRLAAKVDEIHWMRVGQLGKMIALLPERRRVERDHVRPDRAEEPLRFAT